jgi:hypothetical protein
LFAGISGFSFSSSFLSVSWEFAGVAEILLLVFSSAVFFSSGLSIPSGAGGGVWGSFCCCRSKWFSFIFSPSCCSAGDEEKSGVIGFCSAVLSSSWVSDTSGSVGGGISLGFSEMCGVFEAASSRIACVLRSVSGFSFSASSFSTGPNESDVAFIDSVLGVSLDSAGGLHFRL